MSKKEFKKYSMELGYVGEKAFGIQIKPITARSNFGDYKPSERMQASFKTFTEQFGGKVFLIYSLQEEIANQEVIPLIAAEITSLTV